MSIRTLIEINHDIAPGRGDDRTDFLRALQAYINSADRENAERLERFGFKVIGSRHHSGNYYVEKDPDGFPVTVFPAAKERG